MTYLVQAGDTLYQIAQTFNSTVNAIIAANPQITDPNLIYPGQKIIVPTGAANCPLLSQGDRGPSVSRLQVLLQFARFNPGPVDGIFGRQTQAALAAFQQSQKELERTGVADEDTWAALGSQCGIRTEPVNYVVRPGDSLYIIATRFNVPLKSILAANPEITEANQINEDQVIIIPPTP